MADDIDPSELPGAIINEPSQMPTVGDSENDASAMAAQGWRQDKRGAMNESKKQHASGGTVESPASYNAIDYYDDGGSVTPNPQPSGTDPSDIPGAITDQSKLPQMQGDQGIDPADQAGAITDPSVQPDDVTYGTPSQLALATLEQGAQGFAGPLAPLAETKLGLTTPEAMRARQSALEAQEPGLGETAKLAGSVAGLGIGQLGFIGKAGEAVAGLTKAGEIAAMTPEALQAAGITTARALSSKVGAAALKGITEFGLLSTSDEATKAIMEDPNQSMQSALTDIGLSAALGGAGGILFGGAGALLKEGLPKLAQEIENAKGTAAFRANVPEPVTAMHEELSARYNELKEMYDETYGASGIKARGIAQSVPPQVTDAMLAQANDNLDAYTDAISDMRKKPYHYPERLVGKLEADVQEAKNTIFPIDGSTPSSEDIFNAQQDLKQMSAKYAKLDKFSKSTDDDYDFIQDMKPLGTQLKTSLEDTNVWGNAAKLQQSINSNFVKFKPFMEGFEKAFTDKVPVIATGEIIQQPSLNKMQSFLNQAGTFKDVAKKNILKGFLDNGEKYAEGLANAYDAVGQESPFTPSPMVVTRRSLEETTPGMKVMNAIIDKGLGEGAAKGLGAGVGGIAGHTIAGPYGAGIGAYFGEKVFGPMFQKMLPAIAKPLFESVANARGFRMAGRVVQSALKGDQLISQGAKNVFKAGAEVLPVSAIPSIAQIGKLSTQLVAAQNNPQQFSQNVTNNPLGTYMPAHAQSMAQTIGNATNYLNALRPDTSKKAPLDSSRVPSSVQQGSYNNALRIAQQPATVLQKVKDGTITPDDIKHITALYPAAWTKMQSELSSAMASHIAKGRHVPYTTRVGLSMALGQPMDSTFTPQAIQSAQPQGGQPQAPAAQAPKSGKKSSTKDLHKISEQAMTPGQARQQSASKVK
jgi:hypothetical protein